MISLLSAIPGNETIMPQGHLSHPDSAVFGCEPYNPGFSNDMTSWASAFSHEAAAATSTYLSIQLLTERMIGKIGFKLLSYFRLVIKKTQLISRLCIPSLALRLE